MRNVLAVCNVFKLQEFVFCPCMVIARLFVFRLRTAWDTEGTAVISSGEACLSCPLARLVVWV